MRVTTASEPIKTTLSATPPILTPLEKAWIDIRLGISAEVAILALNHDLTAQPQSDPHYISDFTNMAQKSMAHAMAIMSNAAQSPPKTMQEDITKCIKDALKTQIKATQRLHETHDALRDRHQMLTSPEGAYKLPERQEIVMESLRLKATWTAAYCDIHIERMTAYKAHLETQLARLSTYPTGDMAQKQRLESTINDTIAPRLNTLHQLKKASQEILHMTSNAGGRATLIAHLEKRDASRYYVLDIPNTEQVDLAHSFSDTARLLTEHKTQESLAETTEPLDALLSHFAPFTNSNKPEAPSETIRIPDSKATEQLTTKAG
jgi:hypothetical protein